MFANTSFHGCRENIPWLLPSPLFSLHCRARSLSCANTVLVSLISYPCIKVYLVTAAIIHLGVLSCWWTFWLFAVVLHCFQLNYNEQLHEYSLFFLLAYFFRISSQKWNFWFKGYEHCVCGEAGGKCNWAQTAKSLLLTGGSWQGLFPCTL